MDKEKTLFYDVPFPFTQEMISGDELRDEGMARAAAAEDESWIRMADMAIDRLAAVGQEFTAETVRQLVGSPRRPNAFGSRFSKAARHGRITRVGWTQAERATGHSRQLAVWRGVEHG